jgi:hypothetical protein
MIVLRLAACTALVIVLYGQSKPKDVGGWDKIQWGMTIAEVRTAYGVAAQAESKDGWALLQLNPFKMGGVEMDVQVGARQGAGKVTFVRLSSYFGLPNSPPRASAEDFDTLRTMLVQKYGDPASEESTRGENFRLIKNVVWTFPSTSIRLRLEASSSLPNLGNIFLEYAATT